MRYRRAKHKGGCFFTVNNAPAPRLAGRFAVVKPPYAYNILVDLLILLMREWTWGI